jgi:hypothetical protein
MVYHPIQSLLLYKDMSWSREHVIHDVCAPNETIPMHHRNVSWSLMLMMPIHETLTKIEHTLKMMLPISEAPDAFPALDPWSTSINIDAAFWNVYMCAALSLENILELSWHPKTMWTWPTWCPDHASNPLLTENPCGDGFLVINLVYYRLLYHV